MLNSISIILLAISIILIGFIIVDNSNKINTLQKQVYQLQISKIDK